MGGATEQASEITTLGWFFLWAAAAVAAIVYTLIIWSTIRYRKQSDELPPQFRVNLPLEIAYTVIPIVIVAGLFLLTFRTEQRVADEVPDPAAVVAVEAFDWSWRFDYEGTDVSIVGTPDDPPEMVLPAGHTVRIVLTSNDVIHSFYVRDFLFKRDAIPGRTTSFDITPKETGVYQGQCAEFCGLDHYRMRFSIRVVEQDAFEAWLARGSS